MRPIREVTAEEENFRTEPMGIPGMRMIKRDPVEPEPIGTVVALVFRIEGYDRDCDGSLMAKLVAIDHNGDSTGWHPTGIGLYPDYADVVLDSPAELRSMATRPAGDT